MNNNNLLKVGKDNSKETNLSTIMALYHLIPDSQSRCDIFLKSASLNANLKY